MPKEPTYSLTDLCDLADVTPRTVRYYVQQGLLPSPGAGPAARYGDDHLWRLRLIRRLQRDHLPLSEIRRRLSALTPEEVERLAAGEAASVTGSAAHYLATVLGGRGVLRAVAPAPPPAPAGVASMDVRFSVSAPLAVAETAPAEGVEPAIERSQWERISLDPDIELHVRRPLSRTQNRAVERLVAFARQLLKEAP